MKSCITEHYSSKLQNGIYSEVNALSKNKPTFGRLTSIPVALLDVVIETMKTPLKVIETAALAIINFFGAVFSSRCTLKDFLYNIDSGLRHLSAIPVASFMAPFKLLYQFFAIAIHPRTVSSINYFPSTGRNDVAVIY